MRPAGHWIDQLTWRLEIELHAEVGCKWCTRRDRPEPSLPSLVADPMRRAQDKVGLIVSEGMVVNRPASSYDPDVPHFVAGWPFAVGNA